MALNDQRKAVRDALAFLESIPVPCSLKSVAPIVKACPIEFVQLPDGSSMLKKWSSEARLKKVADALVNGSLEERERARQEIRTMELMLDGDNLDNYRRRFRAHLGDATSNGHWVYQSRWMWRIGIPPVPFWMVDWFVTPLERFRPGGQGGLGTSTWMERSRFDLREGEMNQIEHHPHFDANGNFIHPCCKCGEHAALGYSVNLRKGKLGEWYCAECRPPAMTKPPKDIVPPDDRVD